MGRSGMKLRCFFFSVFTSSALLAAGACGTDESSNLLADRTLADATSAENENAWPTSTDAGHTADANADASPSTYSCTLTLAGEITGEVPCEWSYTQGGSHFGSAPATFVITASGPETYIFVQDPFVGPYDVIRDIVELKTDGGPYDNYSPEFKGFVKQGSKSCFLYWYGGTPLGMIDRLTCERDRTPEWQTTILRGEFEATLDCSANLKPSENSESTEDGGTSDGGPFEGGGDPDDGGADDDAGPRHLVHIHAKFSK